MDSTQLPAAVRVVEANLDRADHRDAVLALTAAYALDPMGNGGALQPEVLDRLIPGLRSHPTTLIFLAYLQNIPVGLATCFRGYSTFAARPIINISDLAVLPEHRGKGVGRQLLAAVEAKACVLQCSKVTLEVQENNALARRVYERAGFAQAVYGPATGGSLYYWKTL
jgi:GNAT superfamily N-acetyltransferase